jgi:hypothetical protein
MNLIRLIRRYFSGDGIFARSGTVSAETVRCNARLALVLRGSLSEELAASRGLEFGGQSPTWSGTARPLMNTSRDEWAILRRVIDLIQQNSKGAELGPVLETIETALRADQAKLIEAE